VRVANPAELPINSLEAEDLIFEFAFIASPVQDGSGEKDLETSAMSFSSVLKGNVPRSFPEKLALLRHLAVSRQVTI
jgi:hypothetical protein